MITKEEQEKIFITLNEMIHFLNENEKTEYAKVLRLLLSDNIILQRKLDEKEKANEQSITN